MTLASAGLAGSIAALITAAAASGLTALTGPVDRPRNRGSHDKPTPTAGGLGIMAGSSVGLLLFAILAQTPLAGLGKIAAALGFAAALGLVGALDDLFDLGARIKLLVQVVLATLFAIFFARIEAIPLTQTVALPLGRAIGVLGTALWLVVMVNAVNFMDGANGLAPGSVAIALIAFAFAAFSGGDLALAGAALMTAMGGLGFMPWNFPKARLFQGDAGALFTSFFLAALAVIGGGTLGRGPVFIFFVPLALLPFLADVLLTLLARARAKKPLFAAHSDHLYQRWLAQHGGSHLALAWRTFGITSAFCGAAVVLCYTGRVMQALGFILATATAIFAWTGLNRRARAGLKPPG